MARTDRGPTVPERDVLRQCLRLLALRRIPHWRNNTGGLKREGRYVRFGDAGAPDIMGILAGGRLLCCECKSARGRLSPDQHAWLDRARAAGALVVVARSVDDLMAALAALEEHPWTSSVGRIRRLMRPKTPSRSRRATSPACSP